MNPIQFNKLFAYLGNDEYAYIIPKRGRFVSDNPLVKKLSQVVEKLESSDFLRVNINMKADYSFLLQNVVLKRNKSNSYLLRRSVLDLVLYELQEGLDALLHYKLILLCPTNRFRKQKIRKDENLERRKLNEKRKQITFATKDTSKKLVEWANDNKKKLEKESTKYEKALYKTLQKTFKNRIKTQHPFIINKHLYYADIFIPSLKLIIEVDGGYHNTEEQREKDKKRDADFMSVGYTTLRFTNEQISSKVGKQDIIRKILEFHNYKKQNNH